MANGFKWVEKCNAKLRIASPEIFWKVEIRENQLVTIYYVLIQYTKIRKLFKPRFIDSNEDWNRDIQCIWVNQYVLCVRKTNGTEFIHEISSASVHYILYIIYQMRGIRFIQNRWKHCRSNIESVVVLTLVFLHELQKKKCRICAMCIHII